MTFHFELHHLLGEVQEVYNEFHVGALKEDGRGPLEDKVQTIFKFIWLANHGFLEHVQTLAVLVKVGGPHLLGHFLAKASFNVSFKLFEVVIPDLVGDDPGVPLVEIGSLGFLSYLNNKSLN